MTTKRLCTVFVLIAGILTVLVLAGGLVLSGRSGKSKQECEAYLETTYGEVFDDTIALGGREGDGYAVTSERFPDGDLTVKRNEDGTMSSNYMAYVYEADTRRWIENCARAAWDDVKVIYTPTANVLPSDITPDVPLSHFLCEATSDISAILFVTDDGFFTKDEALEVFRAACEDNGVCLRGEIRIVEDVANVDAETIGDDTCSFMLNEDFTFQHASWASEGSDSNEKK